MNRYFDAQGGLKKLFAGTVGTLICNVVSAIPFLVMVAAVGSLLFTVLAIYGLYQAGKDIPGCKSAFLLYVIEFVVQIFLSAFAFMPMGAAIASICVIAQAILDMVIIYLVCTSVSEVMIVKGHGDIANFGKNVWILSVIAYVIGIVITLMAKIPVIGIIAVLLGIIVAVVKIVAGVLYLIFLYRSSEALA